MISIQDFSWIGPTLMFVFGMILLSLNPANAAGLTITGYALLIGFTVWMYFRCRNSPDEVVRAANVAAVAIGTPIGLALAFLSIFIMRYSPSMMGLITNLAADSNEAVTPAGAAFGMGILFTCAVVFVSVVVTWVGWWIAKR
ncbi:MAG: hypothetical protein AAF512_14460 [Pseudomonadota bacterium]